MLKPALILVPDFDLVLVFADIFQIPPRCTFTFFFPSSFSLPIDDGCHHVLCVQLSITQELDLLSTSYDQFN